jgi:type VI secretion system secreted protein Hcp
MKITLSDCLVSSYHTSGSGGSDIVPLEEVSINFATIAHEYKEQKPDGTLGGTTKMEFNLKTMKASA